jgi:hypothetical protein
MFDGLAHKARIGMPRADARCRDQDLSDLDFPQSRPTRFRVREEDDAGF